MGTALVLGGVHVASVYLEPFFPPFNNINDLGTLLSKKGTAFGRREVKALKSLEGGGVHPV